MENKNQEDGQIVGYRSQINLLFEKFSAKDIQKGINQLISDIRAEEYTNTKIVSHFDLLREKIKGDRLSEALITRHNLRSYVNESLFYPTSLLSTSELSIRKERVEYILGTVLDRRMTAQKLEELTELIMKGGFSEEISYSPQRNFKSDGAYKTIVNHINLKEESKNEQIIKILMVLGLNIDLLVEYLDHLIKPQRKISLAHSDKPKGAGHHAKWNKKWIVLTLIMVASIVIWYVLKPMKDDHPFGRPSVAGDKLYSRAYRLADWSWSSADSLMLKTDTILYESHVEGDPNTPSNQMWIKFWLVNRSASSSVFTHSLIVQSESQFILEGKSIDNQVKIQPVEKALEVTVDCSNDMTYEWRITENTATLKPEEQKYFWIKVSSTEGKCVLPFRVLMSVNDRDHRIIEADRQYDIGLNN